MTLAGLPHSEISGSKRACRSPKRIVACHVLHRLSVPRHPPSTLSNLTIKCLDLMRSAVESQYNGFDMHLFLQPVFNCQGTAVAKTNAELEPAFRFAPTASLAVLFASCLAAVTLSTERGGEVFRLSHALGIPVGGAD